MALTLSEAVKILNHHQHRPGARWEIGSNSVYVYQPYRTGSELSRFEAISIAEWYESEAIARGHMNAKPDSDNVTSDQPQDVKTFDTGAVRSTDCEEFRYDLISPIGMRRLARRCAFGAKKYNDFNWEKGMPVHDLLNHAMKHIYDHLAGDCSDDNLAAAAWGLFAAMHSEELWPHLNEGHLRGPGCTPPVTQGLGDIKSVGVKLRGDDMWLTKVPSLIGTIE